MSASRCPSCWEEGKGKKELFLFASYVWLWWREGGGASRLREREGEQQQLFSRSEKCQNRREKCPIPRGEYSSLLTGGKKNLGAVNIR